MLNRITRRLTRKPRFHYLQVMYKPLQGNLPDYRAAIPCQLVELPPNVECVEKTLAHLPHKHRPDVAKRINSGQICYVGKHNNQVIYAVWLATGTCYSYLLDRTFKLAPDELYSYGAYTLPQFRGKRVHPDMVCQRLKISQAKGYRHNIGFFEPNNTAALKMPKQLGYQYAGVVGMFEIFGIRAYFSLVRNTLRADDRRFFLQKV